MIWKWLQHNWYAVIAAVGILYGMVLSTHNFIETRKTKKRRLDVKITRGNWYDGPEDIRAYPLLFINVSNPGYTSVTIDAPYFELPDGTRYDLPEINADVSFPHELQQCKSCRRWFKEADLMQFYTTSCGKSGDLRLWGVVQDRTGKVWRSKKIWRREQALAEEFNKIHQASILKK
jgi:hypothetical protein